MADPSPTLPATIRWPSETTRPAEHFAQIYRGEALRISCVLTEYAKPVDLTGATVAFYWQPIGADDPTAWWEAPNGAASASGNAVSIVFNAATMDDGHGAYRAFFRIVTQGGATYRANGVLGMLESPGATPNEIPFPPKILDFSTVTVVNAPYWTKAESDARFATPADATLNGRGLGEWTLTPSTVEWNGDTIPVNPPEYGDFYPETGPAHGWYYNNQDFVNIDLHSDNPDETEFTYSFAETTVTATRTALPGYVLGNQTEKPLPKLSDVPAVVPPSTSAADAGKAADAKATGDALAGKLGKTDVVSPTSDAQEGQAADAAMVYGSLQEFALMLADKADSSDLPTAETWTFEVDDGQGGTTAVTKSVAVFAAQAAQGGA